MNITTLNHIRSIADLKGGECLEKIFTQPAKMTFWTCGALHSYMVRPGKNYKGTGKHRWCHLCHKSSVPTQSDKLQADLDQLNIEKDRHQKKLVPFFCAKNHHFELSVDEVLQGKWCAECNEPLGESIARFLMESSEKTAFEKVRPKWLKYKTHPLELDGYSEERGIAIEYDGIQHQQYTPIFHKSEEDFEEQKKRDAFKDKKCAEMGILLLRIPDISMPNHEKMKAHIAQIAQEKAMPIALNPEFQAMLDEHGIKISNEFSKTKKRKATKNANTYPEKWVVMEKSLDKLINFLQQHEDFANSLDSSKVERDDNDGRIDAYKLECLMVDRFNDDRALAIIEMKDPDELKQLNKKWKKI